MHVKVQEIYTSGTSLARTLRLQCSLDPVGTSHKLNAVVGLGAEPRKIWPFFACKSTGDLYKLRVLVYRFSAIYLADSGMFQIHMINSLASLHWAEICRLDSRLSQTTPCRHCSWCTCQRGKLGRVPQKRRPASCRVAHKSHRRASFATLLPRESIVKHSL